MKARVVGATEPHVGDADKPNEDAWRSGTDSEVIAVADGVTRSRLADGTYPAQHSTIAPTTFVDTVVKELAPDCNRSIVHVMHALGKANRAIERANTELGITPETVDYIERDYLGTTGCVLSIDPTDNRAVFAFVGDVIGFFLPRYGEPRLITHDQLHMCHQYSYNHFKKSEVRERMKWQRGYARNNPQAQDPSGNLVGYGVFTGHEPVFHFIETSVFTVTPGDRFILSTDALRTTADEGKGKELLGWYYRALFVVERNPFKDVPTKLIELIRQREKEKSARSDDATIVAVEIE